MVMGVCMSLGGRTGIGLADAAFHYWLTKWDLRRQFFISGLPHVFSRCTLSLFPS